MSASLGRAQSERSSRSRGAAPSSMEGGGPTNRRGAASGLSATLGAQRLCGPAPRAVKTQTPARLTRHRWPGHPGPQTLNAYPHDEDQIARVAGQRRTRSSHRESAG